MASFPKNHFQQFLQPPSSQPQKSNPYRDMYSRNMEGQISQQGAYLKTPNICDHHSSYIPPFQVAGLAPGPAHQENGPDSQWNFGFEPSIKRPTEQVFLENKININKSPNNSQLSSVGFLQAPSVSTGLGLSLDNPRLTCSSGDSVLVGLVGDALDQELQRQDAEFDSCIKLQGELLRQAILDKFKATQLEIVSYVEDKIVRKLREKESEVETINRKNGELMLRIEQLALEANAWQQHAKNSEETINALKANLQQVIAAQNRDSKEGCGDSGIDDTASCCKGQLAAMCKACGSNEACMLLLPCKHLCLCRDCEGRSSACPLCHLSKYIGMEVFM